MPFIPVPFCAKVELLYTLWGQNIANVMHVSYDTAGDLDTLNAIADVFDEWDNSTLHGLRPNQCALQAIRVTDLATETALQVTKEIIPARVGTRGGAQPSGVTLAVTLLTGLRGRSYRGRFYWPGIAGEDVAGDTVTDAAHTAYHNAILNLTVRLTDIECPLVVASLYSGYITGTTKPAPRAEGIITAVTGVSGDNFIDSQRRRLAGRGR